MGSLYFHLRLSLLSLLPLAFFCSNISALAQPSSRLVPAMIIFGDSTVDVGNNNHLRTIAKSNFLPYGRDFDTKKPTGRFCDGRIVTDYIASFLGLPFQLPYLDPQAKGKNLITGINFASSSSGYYDRTSKHLNVIPLSRQLQWYRQYKAELINVVGESNATKILTNALYVVSSGTNDFVNTYFLSPRLTFKYTIPEYNNFIVNLVAVFLQDLYNEGARRIAVVSIPPYGCLPSQIFLHGHGRPGCVALMNQAALATNLKIKVVLDVYKRTLPDVKLAYLDSYTLLLNASENPHNYGFSVSRKGCCGSGRIETAIACNRLSYGTCRNASNHVYWDSFHPTQTMYGMLAKKLFREGMDQLLG